MRRSDSSGRRNRKAFTLIELLLVLTILVIIGALVVPTFLGTQRDAERLQCEGQIGLLENALNLYQLHMGDYPPGDQGLEALFTAPQTDTAGRWKGPYLTEKRLVDPWGRAYFYQYPPQRHQRTPDIWSAGADGQEGTEDDVSNWSRLQTQ